MWHDRSVVRALDSQLRGLHLESMYCHFKTWAISFTPLCQCLGRDSKDVGPIYMVSVPGEVKDPTRGNIKMCHGRTEPMVV